MTAPAIGRPRDVQFDSYSAQLLATVEAEPELVRAMTASLAAIVRAHDFHAKRKGAS